MADASAVARIVGQTDAARDISAALLAQAFTFGATVVMTIVGLVLLEPLAAAVVVAPVAVTLLVVAAMVPMLARRTRRVLRTEEAVATLTAAGAGTAAKPGAIATGCPFCRTMLTDGVDALPDGTTATPVEVLDVAQLLLESVRRAP